MKPSRFKIFALLFCYVVLTAGCAKGKDDSKSPGGDSLTAEQKALIAAVQQTGALSTNGKTVSLICQLSSGHLDYMIQRGKISHDGFPERSQTLQENGETKTSEIVATNCGQPSMEDSAQQCAKSWVKSTDHWLIMKQYWDGYCYDMKQASNGCYYCIGLFGDGSL